jgi:hypothetical protein
MMAAGFTMAKFANASPCKTSYKSELSRAMSRLLNTLVPHVSDLEDGFDMSSMFSFGLKPVVKLNCQRAKAHRY